MLGSSLRGYFGYFVSPVPSKEDVACIKPIDNEDREACLLLISNMNFKLADAKDAMSADPSRPCDMWADALLDKKIWPGLSPASDGTDLECLVQARYAVITVLKLWHVLSGNAVHEIEKAWRQIEGYCEAHNCKSYNNPQDPITIGLRKHVNDIAHLGVYQFFNLASSQAPPTSETAELLVVSNKPTGPRIRGTQNAGLA